jgi:hypothetical protein
MKLSNIKELLRLTNKATVQAFIDNDCERALSDQYVVITEEDARERAYELYRDDYYILGSFQPWFIADFICLDTFTIEALQRAELHEAIGKTIINHGDYEAMIDAFIDFDGWGHVLNSYDGDFKELYDSEEDITYIILRMN